MKLRNNIYNEIIKAVRGKQDDKSMLDNIMKLIETEKAITVTHCCKSDSEQLNHEDFEVGEQVSLTQTKLVEINCFREDGDIDVEDEISVFRVSIDEIQKVV